MSDGAAVGKSILWRGVDLPAPVKVKLTDAERKEFWNLWKDAKTPLAEVIVRTEEFMGKVFERILTQA
jgi:hypothetical protein